MLARGIISFVCVCVFICIIIHIPYHPYHIAMAVVMGTHRPLMVKMALPPQCYHTAAES